MLVKIRRQLDPSSEPYWQSFAYDGSRDITVADLLDVLNYRDDLFDIEGNPARRIRWECSCLQNMCGACAMVIDHVPAMACETFLKELKGDVLILEPLSKFPVISDLVVDRSIIAENLKNAGIFQGKYRQAEAKAYDQLYATAKCVKCGLCLEVCPNYHKGEDFFGAVFANESYLTATQSADRAGEIKKAYDRHFAKGCSNAFSCIKVCPAGIDTLSSIARMNRMKTINN